MKCTRLERVEVLLFLACCHLSLTYRTTGMRDVLERHGWPFGDRSKSLCTLLFLGEQLARYAR